MGRKILALGSLLKAYKDKKSNPDSDKILIDATNKLISLPKV